MKLADFYTVQLLVSERSRLQTKLTAKLGVTIGGTYQDDAIVELVRPIVAGEMRAQISRIDADLRKLGVEP